MATYKYLDKNLLERINAVSRDVLKYNRALPQDYVDKLPSDRFYVITWSMIHEHIAGQPAEPHMRCLIYGGPGVLNPMILDMHMSFYDLLPETEDQKETEPTSSEPEVAAT